MLEDTVPQLTLNTTGHQGPSDRKGVQDSARGQEGGSKGPHCQAAFGLDFRFLICTMWMTS